MDQMVIWINIFAFSLMIGSWTFYIFKYTLRPTFSLRMYLVYHGSYALWLFFSTLIYFNLTFYGNVCSYFNYIAEILHTTFIVISTLSFSLFSLSILKGHVSLKSQIIVSYSPLILSLGIIIAHLVNNFGVLLIVCIITNSYLLFLNIYLRRFILFSVAHEEKHYYYSFISYNIIAQTAIVAVLITIFFYEENVFVITLDLLTGIYCFFWALIFYSIHFNRLGSKKEVSTYAVPYDIYDLTNREKEIIKLLLNGKSNKSIANELNVSIRTVEKHIYNIFRKTKVSNRFELISSISRRFTDVNNLTNNC